jgi:phage head maturation protease
MTQPTIASKRAKTYAVKSTDAGSLHIKDVDTTKRIVTGFYNTCNFFDSDQDVLLPGSCDKSISERGPASDAVAKVKHLMFHDWTLLPGKLMTLTEKTESIDGMPMTGLYFETKMVNTQLGTDTLINYQEGIYDNHSIGFQYMQGEYIDSEAENWQKVLSTLINPQDAEEAGYAFLWKEIKLYEGSTVAFGANEMTPYLGVKSENKEAMVLKLQSRIATMGACLKNGRQSDEALYDLEMQMKQLSQIVSEIFQPETDVKGTLKESRPTTPPAPEKLNFERALSQINF